MRMLIKKIAPLLVFVFIPISVDARDIYTLEKGSYIPKGIGCDGLGGVGSTYFDGSNISGHYQICKTRKLDQKDMYQSDCIEHQGPNPPNIEEIEKNPDKVSVTQRIEAQSKTSFVINKTTYIYCGK